MNDCKHEHFNSYAAVGRHSATDDGPIFGFTVSLRLECADCKELFHFGKYVRFKDGMRQEVEMTCAPGRALLEAPWIPGQFECPKCMFRLSSNILSATTGAVAPNRKAAPETCPNDGEVMRRVTWQQQARDAVESATQAITRVRQLEDTWPEGYAMPATLGQEP